MDRLHEGNYKPFHKYKHISFTRPYNIAPHTHAYTHTKKKKNMVLRASYLPPLSRISSILLALSAYHMHSEVLHLWSTQISSPIPLLLSPWKKRCILKVRSLSGEDPLEESMASHSIQYSCLKNPMDRGTWWATVHRVTKSRTQLKQLSTYEL